MDDKIRPGMKLSETISQRDAEYIRMPKEMGPLEKRYDAVLQTLSNEHQDVLCDFVSLCEEMSAYQLQLACTHMRFPE